MLLIERLLNLRVNDWLKEMKKKITLGKIENTSTANHHKTESIKNWNHKPFQQNKIVKKKNEQNMSCPFIIQYPPLTTPPPPNHKPNKILQTGITNTFRPLLSYARTFHVNDAKEARNT